MLPSRCERPSPVEVVRSSTATPAFDPAIVAELEACFGRIGLLDLLGRLRDEIAARLLAPAAERGILDRDAHILVSASGTMGFLTLSQACDDLGRACRTGIDLAPALALARQAAGRAREAIDGLLAEPA